MHILNELFDIEPFDILRDVSEWKLAEQSFIDLVSVFEFGCLDDWFDLLLVFLKEDLPNGWTILHIFCFVGREIIFDS